MGLDCSPGNFRIGYIGFHALRGIVARAIGGSFPPHSEEFKKKFATNYSEPLKEMWWYVGDDYDLDVHRGMDIFLRHSDCDGEISPQECVLVARDLQAAMPDIEAEAARFAQGTEIGGHEWVAALKRFIDACNVAADEGVPLVFH